MDDSEAKKTKNKENDLKSCQSKKIFKGLATRPRSERNNIVNALK